MKALLGILFAVSLHAQSFFAAGASFQASSQPKSTGWAISATEVSKSAQLWSISGVDFSTVRSGSGPWTIQTTAWTAGATPLRKFGLIQTYALAGLGGASTGTNAGYAITGGFIGTIPIKKMLLLFGYAVEKSSIGGSQNLVKIGFGGSGK